MILDEMGFVKSAIGLVGSAEEPTVLDRGISIFADNVLAEINVPPAVGLLQWLSQLRKALELAAIHLFPKQLMIKSSLQFPPDELADLRSWMFGCSPEYNAWDLDTAGLPKRVPSPLIRHGNGFRSCGGHIHIGCKAALDNPVRLVQVLDLFVGVTSVLIDKDPTSQARRQIYGGAGNFRPTRYGLEYRTPSNFWLASPGHAMVIYRLVDLALKWCKQPLPDPVYKDIINHHARPAAETIWRDDLSPLLMESGAFSLYDAICDLKTATPGFFYKAWGLDKVLDRVEAGT